jgi:hypothetical protein
MCGSAVHPQQSVEAFLEARAEHGMPQIRTGFVETADREAHGHGAQPEACELRKDVPHPVRALVPASDLGERAIVGKRLRVDETGEIVRIVHASASPSIRNRARRAAFQYSVDSKNARIDAA